MILTRTDEMYDEGINHKHIETPVWEDRKFTSHCKNTTLAEMPEIIEN